MKWSRRWCAAGLVAVGAFPGGAWPWVALALCTMALGVVQPLLRDRGSLPHGYGQTLVVARADRLADQVLAILGFSGLCALAQDPLAIAWIPVVAALMLLVRGGPMWWLDRPWLLKPTAEPQR